MEQSGVLVGPIRKASGFSFPHTGTLYGEPGGRVVQIPLPL